MQLRKPASLIEISPGPHIGDQRRKSHEPLEHPDGLHVSASVCYMGITLVRLLGEGLAKAG